MASNYEELYLLKISGAGEKLWERKFASPGNHYCYGAAVIEAQDGGYVTAGYSDFSPQGFNVKVDAAGNTVWIKNNYILCEQGEGIVQTTDLALPSPVKDTLKNLIYPEFCNGKSIIRIMTLWLIHVP
jgi:hypothetical protein